MMIKCFRCDHTGWLDQCEECGVCFCPGHAYRDVEGLCKDHQGSYNKDEEPPSKLLHIQDRDLWEFKYGDTKAVTEYISSLPHEFDTWDRLITSERQDFISEGRTLLRKKEKDIREFIESAAYTTNFDGFYVPIINCPYMWGSDTCHILAKNVPFAMYYWDNETFRHFGLRSDKDGVDVSLIAKRFGGGGHIHAAGFTLTPCELFELQDKDELQRSGIFMLQK